jgi:hypothetical protein
MATHSSKIFNQKRAALTGQNEILDYDTTNRKPLQGIFNN